MKLLTDQMGIQHHVASHSLIACPWANGSVEIVGRELLWTTRALLSELGYSVTVTDRVLILPLVQAVVNYREREVLRGRRPIEVMTGRKPRTALDLVVWDGVLLKDTKGVVAEWKRVEKYCGRLIEALDQMHQEIRDKVELKRRQKAAKAVNASRAIQFEVGDLVMVAAWGNAAHVKGGLNYAHCGKDPMKWLTRCQPLHMKSGCWDDRIKR